MPGQWDQQWRLGNFVSEQRNAGSAYGEFSKMWQYQAGPHPALLSLDFPFSDRHNVTECYEANGWVLGERVVHWGPTATGDTQGFVEIQLRKPGYRYGYLLFTLFDQDGMLVEPLEKGFVQRFQERMASFQQRWLGGEADGPPAQPPRGPFFQCQLLVESYAPLTPAEQAQAQAFFQQGLKTLRQKTKEP
jgi:hypothetical protein